MSDLTEAEFLSIRDRAMVVARSALTLVKPEELAAFIRMSEHADVIGPFLDPSLWQNGRESAQQTTALMRAVSRFRRELVELVGEEVVAERLAAMGETP